MQILNINQSNNYKKSFGSKNYPIAPFILKTNAGDLNIEELKLKDTADSGKFSLDCGVEAFQDWKEDYDTLSGEQKLKWQKQLIRNHQRILKKSDGNSTILIGRDSSSQIRTLFSLHNFDEYKQQNLIDLQTAHLEECMIDAKYRNQGIGKIMLEKLLSTAKGHFTDIFVEADNNAWNFYQRAGFNKLDLKNQTISKIAEIINSERDDKDLITLATKSLDGSGSWWKRLTKNLPV